MEYTLKEMVEHNKEIDSQIKKAIALEKTKVFPSEERLKDYLPKSGFTRVERNFGGINFSSVSKYLEENPIYYHKDGYIFGIDKTCCGCELAEDDGIDYTFWKIKNPNKRRIKRVIKNFDINATFKKDFIRSGLLGFVGAGLAYLICKDSGTNNFESIAFMITGYMVGFTFSLLVSSLVIDEVLEYKSINELARGKQNTLEKLIEVTEREK